MRRVCRIFVLAVLALWLAQSTTGWAHATSHHETRGHCAVCHSIIGTPAVLSASPGIAPLFSCAVVVARDVSHPAEPPGRTGYARGPPPHAA